MMIESKSHLAEFDGFDTQYLLKLIENNRIKKLIFIDFIKYVTIMLIRC